MLGWMEHRSPAFQPAPAPGSPRAHGLLRRWLAGAAGLTALIALLASGGCGRPTTNSSSSYNIFGNSMSEKASEYVERLKSPDANERNVAIIALSNIQDPHTVPALIQELDDPVEWNRYNAAGALVRITNQNFQVDEKDKWQKWWDTNQDYFLDHYDEIRKKMVEDEGAKVWAGEAYNLFAQHKYPAAIEKMRMACARTPSNWEYHNLLGQCYLGLGYVIDARLEFEVALGIRTDALEPRLNLARSYVEIPNPDWEMGQNILENAMALETKILAAKKVDDRKRNWQLPYVLGWIMLNRGDATRDDFRNAVRLFKDSLQIQEDLRIPNPSLDVINELVIAAHRAGLEYEAWKRILQIRALGYDVNEGLYNDVKQALEAQDANIVVPPYHADTEHPVLETSAGNAMPRPPDVFKSAPQQQ
ncbi:MAG: hypothetical protein ACREJ2_06455 [Planctomycetota bacterium]